MQIKHCLQFKRFEISDSKETVRNTSEYQFLVWSRLLVIGERFLTFLNKTFYP